MNSIREVIQGSLRKFALIVLPQIVLVQLIMDHRTRKTISKSEYFLLFILAAIAISYWISLITLRVSFIQGLVLAEIGSFCITVFLYVLWDEARIFSGAKRPILSLDVFVAALIVPGVMLNLGLLVSSSIAPSITMYECSLISAMVVTVGILLAVTLLASASILIKNPLITELPFPVPRRRIRYQGIFVLFVYVLIELSSIHDHGLITDWKIISCIVHQQFK